MVEKESTEKLCSLYVDNMHLIVMLIPYIEKELGRGNNIFTILEDDLEPEVKTLIEKVSLDENKKKKLVNMNWKKTMMSFKEIDKLEEEYFLIKGSPSFVREVNKNIGGEAKKIINCFEIKDFENNSREILEEHDKILNTMGECKISEMFHTDIRKNGILTK